MGMPEFYEPADETEALATTRRALELGVSLLLDHLAAPAPRGATAGARSAAMSAIDT